MDSSYASVECTSTAFDSDSGTYRAQFDQTTTSPSLAVVSALSAAMDTDPTELTPLYEFVDTDALDQLLGDTNPTDKPRSVTLTVEQHLVTVNSDGTIAIDPSVDEGPVENVDGDRDE